MYKAKQRFTTLLWACFAVLVSVLFALSLWTTPTNIQASADTVSDTLTQTTIGVTGSSYTAWSGKTWNSDAVYAGQTSAGTEIQMRATSPSAIITTASGGKAKTVTVVWHSSTTTDRTLDIYGKNTAYTATTDLYSTSTQGTKLGSIVKGTSTSFTISGDYEYIGLRSNKGAMYLTSITIEWEVAAAPDTCEHANKTETGRTDATCEAVGEIVYTCSDCGETVTEEIEALGHDKQEEITTPATCTAVGLKTITCSRCTFNDTEDLPMVAHNYENDQCTVCGADLPLEETLAIIASQGTLAGDSLSISWTGNKVKFVNEKAGSSTAIRTTDSDQYRVYASSTVTISTVDGENITQVVISYSSSSYTTVCKTSLENAGYSATVDGNNVTVITDGTANSISFTASAQWRLNQIVVSYVKGATTCEHTYETTATVSATCTTDGLKTETCTQCSDVKETVLPATGHTEVENIVTPATCTAVGSKTITCENCAELNETVELPIIPHNYENGSCTICGNEISPVATLTFDDTAKRTSFSTEEQVWTENSVILTHSKADSSTPIADYTSPVRFYKNSTITIAYPQMVKIIFACNSASYATALQTAIGNAATANGKIVTVKFAEPVDSFTVTLSADQVRMDSLTVISTSAPVINSASVTLGEDITLNYYVTIPEEIFSDTTLVFTVNGENLDVAGVVQQDGRYKFSLELPPQYMADNVQAVLSYNGVIVDQIDNYSIKAYAESQLSTASNELKQLISDMLHYGAAAQIYKDYNVENLANENVEGILTASEATPEATDFLLTNNEEVDSYPAYFAGAGVHFDNVNKLYVKLSTTENVTLTVNEVAVEITGTTFYTDGIQVTNFDETYTFVLSHGGVVMQTLTYSVNAYAYAMKDNATMQDLALALYRYGVSAEAYQESLNA